MRWLEGGEGGGGEGGSKKKGGGISVTMEEVEAMKERLAKMEEAEKEAAAKAAKLAEELKQADEVREREREGPHASYEPEHPAQHECADTLSASTPLC